MKKFIAWLTLAIMLASLASCKGGSEPQQANTAQPSGKLFSEPCELEVLIGSHASWPYKEGLLMWDLLEEKTGANIIVTAVPNTDFYTKVSLALSTRDEMPDMIHFFDKGTCDLHAASGALVAIDDHMDLMQNYSKFWSTLPEDTRDAFLVMRKSGDGKTYFPQVYGAERLMNLRTWMYRKDIFEKNSLSVPTTMDELYETAKKLKELYPDSYPYCVRNGLDQISTIGPEWKPYFTYSTYYDFTNEKWSYGVTEPVMVDIVNYFIKLRKEELIPSDFLTINAKSWEELVSTNRGFMMNEYMVRFDFFNIPNRIENPDYTWSIMNPPRAGTDTAQSKIAKFNVDPTGYAVCNTGDETGIENSFKLLDWMYSDEAVESLSWGIEGESYEIKDGKRSFILAENETAAAKYGVGTYGVYQRIDPAANEAKTSEEQSAMMDVAIANLENYYNPVRWVALNDEELSIGTDLGSELETYTKEKLSKFLLEQLLMSEWDSFVKDLYDMGLDNWLALYDGAYSRALGK